MNPRSTRIEAVRTNITEIQGRIVELYDERVLDIERMLELENRLSSYYEELESLLREREIYENTPVGTNFVPTVEGVDFSSSSHESIGGVLYWGNSPAINETKTLTEEECEV